MCTDQNRDRRQKTINQQHRPYSKKNFNFKMAHGSDTKQPQVLPDEVKSEAVVKNEGKKRTNKHKKRKIVESDEVIDLLSDSDDEEKAESLHAVRKVRKLRTGNAYSKDCGSNKGKPWQEIRSERDLHFCMNVVSNNGKPSLNLSGNVPKAMMDNQEHFDKLLSDNHATSADDAGKGSCANTKHNMSRHQGTITFPPNGPSPTIAVVSGDSQTIATNLWELLDREYLDTHQIRKVLNLRFYEGDFVIVVLPVDRRGLADIYLYSSQRNCYRENGKMGKVAADLIEAFPKGSR